MMSFLALAPAISFRQCRQKLCKQGSCFGTVKMFIHTEQATCSRSLPRKVLISMIPHRTERWRLLRNQGTSPLIKNTSSFFGNQRSGEMSVLDNKLWKTATCRTLTKPPFETGQQDNWQFNINSLFLQYVGSCANLQISYFDFVNTRKKHFLFNRTTRAFMLISIPFSLGCHLNVPEHMLNIPTENRIQNFGCIAFNNCLFRLAVATKASLTVAFQTAKRRMKASQQ